MNELNVIGSLVCIIIILAVCSSDSKENVGVKYIRTGRGFHLLVNNMKSHLGEIPFGDSHYAAFYSCNAIQLHSTTSRLLKLRGRSGAYFQNSFYNYFEYDACERFLDYSDYTAKLQYLQRDRYIAYQPFWFFPECS